MGELQQEHEGLGWSTPQHPSWLPWFHSCVSSGAGNKRQPGDHHKINQKATQKPQTSNKAVVKAACECAGSSDLSACVWQRAVTQLRMRATAGSSKPHLTPTWLQLPY